MKVTQGVNVKLVVIAVLILLILIPMGMIESLISERQARKTGAVLDVTSKWGGKQVITGPVITVPYKVYSKNGSKETVEVLKYKHFLPEQLGIEGSMTSEIRPRGIYEVVLYNVKITLTGSFPASLLAQFDVPAKDVLFEHAVLSIGVSDMGGIKKRVEGIVANKKIEMEPGLTNKDVMSVGVHSKKLRLSGASDHSFKIHLDINGSESLAFIPVAKENAVYFQSDWKSPSFSGAFLPEQYTINNDGFSSEWRVLNLNRNYPQSWDGEKYKVDQSAFGVKLYIESDLYKKSTRVIKYALLFIVFTFAAFFCVEILNGSRVHPFQYLLVGLAVSVFYILLVSISEHTNFDLSYCISSAATVLLIGLYAKSIFRKNKLPLIIMGMLIILYGFIYVLMQLEDFALLIGSVGLFSGLAVIMYITRKIDWYELPDTRPAKDN